MALEHRPGDAERRPGRGTTFSFCSQAAEETVRLLRFSTVLVTMSEARSDINPQMVAKALERELHIPFDQMHVSKHFPEPFLVRFVNTTHRDTALAAGVASCRGVALLLAAWTPAVGGHQRVWRYYCRLAIERVPLQCWNKEDVQDAVGRSCVIDRLERQSLSFTNTACVYAWAWAWNPDCIPTSNDYSGQQGPLFPVLIHLDTTKDFAPLPEGSSASWPHNERFRYELGVEDNAPAAGAARRRSGVHDRLRHDRRDDDDEDAPRGRRRRDRSRGNRHGGLLGCRSDGSVGGAGQQQRRHRDDGNNRSGRRRAAEPRDASTGPALEDPGHVRSRGRTRTRSRSRSRSRSLEGSRSWSSPPGSPVGVLALSRAPVLLGMPLAQTAVEPGEGLHGAPVVAGSEPDMQPLRSDLDSFWHELTRCDPLLLEDSLAPAPAMPAPVWSPLQLDDDAMIWPTQDENLGSWAGLSAAELGLEPFCQSAPSLPAQPEGSGAGPLKPWPSLGFLAPEAYGGQVLPSPLPPVVPQLPPALEVDALTTRLGSLEVDGNTTFMTKIFGLLPPSIMGAPPAFAPFAADELIMVPTPAPAVAPPVARRSSARIAKTALGLTQAQKAQARLAQQLDFIDGPHKFTTKTRAKYVDRFKAPLGSLTSKLARAAGVHSSARILLPDDELAPLAGEALGAAA
ncbi:hypothetical protein ACQ4PT_048230 [Festuca glaucescens]